MNDFVQHYELEWLQEQIYDLQQEIRNLQMENELLRNDLNSIKIEGCYRFVDNSTHIHKGEKDGI